jgi:hypothetical protein
MFLVRRSAVHADPATIQEPAALAAGIARSKVAWPDVVLDQAEDLAEKVCPVTRHSTTLLGRERADLRHCDVFERG